MLWQGDAVLPNELDRCFIGASTSSNPPIERGREAVFCLSLSERFKLADPLLTGSLSSSGSSSSVMVALDGLLEALIGSEMDFKNSEGFLLVTGLCSVETRTLKYHYPHYITE